MKKLFVICLVSLMMTMGLTETRAQGQNGESNLSTFNQAVLATCEMTLPEPATVSVVDPPNALGDCDAGNSCADCITAILTDRQAKRQLIILTLAVRVRDVDGQFIKLDTDTFIIKNK